MLGTKILLILVPILLVQAQNNSPRRPGLARRLPFFRPGGRPGPFTVVTSIPVAPTTTEKIQIVSEQNPSVTLPKDNIINSIENVKPTELTIVYPENYKPASTSSPPIPSSRGREPVRLPLYRPRPTIGSSFIVPTTPPPPTPSPKPIESVIVNMVASAPPSNELVMIQSTEKQPELVILPISTEPVYVETPISEEPISKEPISEEPIFEEPISQEPVSEEPISEEPISEEPISEEPISEEPISAEPISEEPISEEPISEEPISEEPISEEPISEEPISEEPISEEPMSEQPILISNESESPRPTLIEPSINQPINWHIISVPATTPRPISSRSPIIIVPSAPATQKPPKIVQPTIVISQRPPVSEQPIEIKPVESISDNISPNMDVFNPPTPSRPNSAVIGSNKPSRQPSMIWYPTQQKPKTTLVPTTTEIYAPTITQKPHEPVSAAKPWSQPADTTYTVNRLHDYICKSMDGYESVLNKCDTYIECKSNLAFQNTCPDGLHFNPSAQWPEYPCGYPSEVQCRSQDAIQEPQPSDQCPHRYGFYPLPGSDCGQYIMCQEGLATVMSCPPGLAFSPITSSCDWPANVPGCSPLIFREYTCPPSAVDKYGRQTFDDSKFRYGKSCKQYIVCHKGNPRLLSCDAGMAFDEESETCIDADQVMDCQQ